MIKKKKKQLVVIIVTMTLLFFILVLILDHFRKKSDLEYSVLVADHIFYLRDTEQCSRGHFSDEEDFLNYCKDEEIAEVVKYHFQFDFIIHISDEVVIFVLKEPFIYHRGYAVVRNDASLPNHETTDFQTATFEQINERVYLFKWLSLME